MALREIAYSQSEWIEDLRVAGGDAATAKFGRLEAVAEEVVIAKADAACEAMILLAALRIRMGDRWNVAALDHGAARVQKTQAVSSTDFRQQAAHLLPGNILINNRSAWLVADEVDTSGRLGAQLKMAFANTISLPACFNVADSRAEMGHDGLKKAFVDAVIVTGRMLRPAATGALAVRSAVDAGLKLWFFNTDKIYQQAAGKKAAAAQTASGDARQARLLEARVLTAYAHSFKVAHPMRHVDANPALRALMERGA